MSVLFVCVTKSLKNARKLGKKVSIKKCAESAWRLSESRVTEIDTVVAVSKGEVLDVFYLADGKRPHKISRGHNKGRYYLPLKKAPYHEITRFSGPVYDVYRKMYGSFRYCFL